MENNNKKLKTMFDLKTMKTKFCEAYSESKQYNNKLKHGTIQAI